MDKICSCFGHRKVEDKEALIKELERLYRTLIENQNYNIFYFGGYGEFDELCQKVIRRLKAEFTNIKMIYVRPYYKELNQSIINLYKKDFDDCIYLNLKNEFRKLSIIYRNYAMVDNSDFVIFYVNTDKKSGAFKIYNYAISHSKNFINFGKFIQKS